MYAYITLKFELTEEESKDFLTAQTTAEELSTEIVCNEIVKIEIKDD